ncbi:disintegrin and metalloproteinase domain-containing protein 32-like isoform X2 [Macrotis lagotis]|uniref:disintegrin and metalloproteinase domain-containing protein 32-like isoform X2 n=1 Tax=Macrotis lagotis TaxID=92651 RepID=UPI003D684CEC
MLYLLALSAGLSRLLTSGFDHQQSFVEIIVPEKIPSNSSDSDSEYEGISYNISIEGRVYTLHLKKRLFLPDDFVVYMYNREGALYSNSKSTMKYCNYQGHIAGFPNSVVTLHACSGLRGLLQFENVTYGIEPLGSTGGFEHLIYRLRSENTDLAVLKDNNKHMESENLEYKVVSSVKYPKGITIEAFSVIIAQLLGLSLGIRYDDKRCHCLQSTCIMSPEAVLSSGIKVFSHCSLNDLQNFISKTGAKCLKNQPTLKFFVSHFSQTSATASTCGNYIVSDDEDCDCGPPSVCGFSTCCNPSYCRKSHFANCISGVCCQPNCQYNTASLCRPAYDILCDFPEQCNGSSAVCPRDLKAKDGSICANFGSICYGGKCQNPDRQCQRLYGKDSRNAPFSCYEEINSQQDRFGNCGRRGENAFKFCSWRNLLCGKLICTYPLRKPYVRENVAVIYSFVLNTVCISLDHKFKGNTPDPMLLADGSPCDVRKYCMKAECVYINKVLEEAKACSKKNCHEHGACTDDPSICVCELDFHPPNCRIKKSKALNEFMLSVSGDYYSNRIAEYSRKNWMLISICISIPIFFIIIIIIFNWKSLKECFFPEESPITESGSEFSSYSYSSGNDHST